jgi:hypothetical protein
MYCIGKPVTQPGERTGLHVRHADVSKFRMRRAPPSPWKRIFRAARANWYFFAVPTGILGVRAIVNLLAAAGPLASTCAFVGVLVLLWSQRDKLGKPRPAPNKAANADAAMHQLIHEEDVAAAKKPKTPKQVLF